MQRARARARARAESTGHRAQGRADQGKALRGLAVYMFHACQAAKVLPNAVSFERKLYG